jgi:hypothetical protein
VLALGADVLVEESTDPAVEFGDVLGRQVQREPGQRLHGVVARLAQLVLERLDRSQPGLPDGIGQPPGLPRGPIGLFESATVTGPD